MDSRKLRIPDHVVSREVGEETVVLNMESGTYFGLNAVGAKIWKGLEAGASLADIRQGIIEAFAAPSDVIERDMEELIRRLLEKGLLEE